MKIEIAPNMVLYVWQTSNQSQLIAAENKECAYKIAINYYVLHGMCVEEAVKAFAANDSVIPVDTTILTDMYDKYIPSEEETAIIYSA